MCACNAGCNPSIEDIPFPRRKNWRNISSPSLRAEKNWSTLASSMIIIIGLSIFFFFLVNHWKYTKKVIKLITKTKYKDLIKKKTNLEKKIKRLICYNKVLWSFQIWTAKNTWSLSGGQNILVIEKNSCTNFVLDCQPKKHLNFQRGPFNPDVDFKNSIISRRGTIN